MDATFYFTWPSPKLSPNARQHHMVTHKAKKAYKRDCGWVCKQAGLGVIDADGLKVSYTFFPPSRARFDRDNLASRMKAATDSISECVGIDDHYFTFGEPVLSGAVEKHGLVKVELNWTPREAKAA